MKDYKQSPVRQKSKELLKEVYRLLKKLPSDEKYILGDQMKRSALSIPCNVAEGSQRIGIKDYIRFLGIARGSATELETQIIVAFELCYIEEDLYKCLV